ncbi:MAG: AAA family ATPase, partial [bacterium]|nr:AAA family ATPase [bacterium]
ADKRALHHGYLFTGPKGVGKSFFARSLSAYLETDTSAEKSSFASPSRKATDEQGKATEGRPVLNDMMLVLPTEGTLGIDAVREIKNFLWQKPNVSPYRTVIVDDAELLTTEAQNALLKITEEPPASGLVILVAHDEESLLPTLRSRLERIYFGLIAEKEISSWLMAEGVSASESAKLAKNAFGKPERALYLKDHTEGAPYEAQAKEFLNVSGSEKSALVKEWVAEDDFSLAAFLDGLIAILSPRAQEFGDAWHAILELRRKTDYYNLNPRIQLEALARQLTANN